jgi:hypothetical protein
MYLAFGKAWKTHRSISWRILIFRVISIDGITLDNFPNSWHFLSKCPFLALLSKIDRSIELNFSKTEILSYCAPLWVTFEPQTHSQCSWTWVRESFTIFTFSPSINHKNGKLLALGSFSNDARNALGSAFGKQAKQMKLVKAWNECLLLLWLSLFIWLFSDRLPFLDKNY